MSIYQDSNSLWHDKPCKNGLPSSNNWMIYTFYAHLLGLPIDSGKMRSYFKQCVVKLDRNNILINRHPGKIEPPLSHDEALGAYGLGLIPYTTLKGNHFMYRGKGSPLRVSDLEKILRGITKLILHHNINLCMSKKKKIKQRNLFWKRNIEELYGVAFRLNPALIYVIKRASGQKWHVEEEKLYAFWRDCLKKNKSNATGVLSQKNMLWACMILLGDHGQARSLKPWENFDRYFGIEHDLSKSMKLYYGI